MKQLLGLIAISDHAWVGSSLGRHLDVASFWTELCGGVQAEQGGKGSLVGQVDSPWNGLANDVRTKVNELAVNFWLENDIFAKFKKNITCTTVSEAFVHGFTYIDL